MKQVLENLFVGTQFDYQNGNFGDEWAFCLAAKEPFHRSAIGYTGRACDKSHPEYFTALRGNALILNLVDAPKPEFFDKSIINRALAFIDSRLKAGFKVLVVCNQGESRSPSIALLYLIKHGIIKGDTLEDCEAEFMRIYPEYNPGTGMRGFVKEHFNEYILK